MALTELPNIGKVLEGHLLRVGVDTPEALRALGAEEAFRRIRALVDPGACLHELYALEGAVRGVPDRALDAETRDRLKAFIKTL